MKEVIRDAFPTLAGSALPNSFRSTSTSAHPPRLGNYHRLTLFGIEPNHNIIVLTSVLQQIQRDKFPIMMLVVLQRGELGVHEADAVLPSMREGFIGVDAAEDEVHGAAEREILEEGDELDVHVLSHDLQPGAQSFHVLVDGDSFASSRDGEAGCKPAELVSYAQTV